MLLAILYFYVYGTIGWLLELTYQVMYFRRYSHGGFSFLPFCPIYGIAAHLILITMPVLLPLPFVVQALVLGALLSIYELVGGIFSEWLFKKRLWDYSGNILHIRGYADLEHTAGWAIFGTYFYYVLHPAVASLMTRLV